MTTDRFAGVDSGLTGPAENGAVVTPDDNNDLPIASKRLWIGGAGNVALVTIRGAALTYIGVPAGYLNVRASRVKATGTTATNIIAEY